MWMLILIAVHLNDPLDQPGKVELQFQDQKSCEQVLSTMTWTLKFKGFKVVGECQRKYS